MSSRARQMPCFFQKLTSRLRETLLFHPDQEEPSSPGLLLRLAAWPFDSPRTESQKFMGASCRQNAYFFSPAKSEGHPNSSINLKARPAHKFLSGRWTCAVRGSHCQHSAPIRTQTTPFRTWTNFEASLVSGRLHRTQREHKNN